MRILKFLGIALGAIVLAVAGVAAYAAATQPDSFRVSRSLDISAPPEKIYSILSDFHRSPEWSPYEKLDPDMKRTHSGAPAGKGAVYAWDGDSNAGAGRMEIVEATPGPRDGWLTISVTDTGSGVPAGDLPHIFEPFHQLGPSSTRRTTCRDVRPSNDDHSSASSGICGSTRGLTALSLA